MIRLNKTAVLLFFVVLTALALPSAAPAQIAVGVSIHIGPPALPVYVQPVCPAPGYIWAPGYWAYGPVGYYWVPGTWVLAPTPGYLWTPGYWGWGGGVYAWHAGYWGPHVGFYGGINYGFGYGGVGFVGGEWRGGVFHYNTAVTSVNTTVIHNTYVNNTVVNRTVVNNNVSYNGGAGGVTAQPTAQERAAMNEHHVQPTSLQTQHEEAARSDRSMLASENHGRPAVAATAHPGVFKGEGVVAAHAAGNTNRPNNMQADRPPSARTNNSSNNNANRPSNVSSHSEDRPPQSAAHSESVHNNQNNSNHPNNAQGNANHNNNNNHPNSSKPPQHQNKPPEHESHQGGGHER
ncbi:MAG: YXWGXW repeat-containing protein [Candidatus Acidiferrum sp.]